MLLAPASGNVTYFWEEEELTTERWDDERLDRLADNVAANAEAISQLIGAMRNQQESNTEIFQAIVQEIRGLRAENRRILTHLFGEQSE
jgi:hypothetical protein